MAEGLILEFEGVGKAEYDKVNSLLGIDSTKPDSDWPDGLQFHAGGPTEGGGFVVMEVWESQAANEKFMAGRLGAALAQAGVPAPSRVTWSSLLAATAVAL